MSTSLDWFTPRRFILISLGTDPETMAQSRVLIRAGEHFGMTANRLRVALSRLVADGVLENPERGYYRLSSKGALLQQEIDGWRELDSQRVEWQGDWCAVLTENLASAGSTLWRHQLRVLSLRGMARWRPGLWVRPDNLTGGLEQLVGDLKRLGLDAIQGAFVVARADQPCVTDLRSLWDCAELDRLYLDHESRLQKAIARIGEIDMHEALTETLSVGSETVRFLNKDPLLPDGMVDAQQRRRIIATMAEYDVLGKKLWQEFYRSIR